MKIKYFIIIIFLLCTSRLIAQPVSATAVTVKFTAFASKNQVGTAEPFEVTFTVNTSGTFFTAPSFNGFRVVGGPNMSQSMTSVNGNTTESTSYSYYLIAFKTGEYTIDPAVIFVNGYKYSTNPIKITVVKGKPVKQNAEAVAEGNTSDSTKILFIRAEANKTKVFQGEQLTVSYTLYTRVTIVNVQLDKLPDLNGFWSEDTKSMQQQAQWRTEVYKGIKYNVTDIKQSILFPEHSGDLPIDPLEMTFVIRVADNDMDQFFGTYKDIKYKVKSAPLTIHVKPLPEAGKPVGFSGAVGNFSVAATIDKRELKANESLNYTVRVSGTGNLKLLKPPTPTFPLDFERYDPKVTDSIKEDANGLHGSRSYNYLLIPRHKGDDTIDPLKFSYFNPATGRYSSLSTKSINVKVNKGITEGNVTAFMPADKQDIKILNKDIRYIKNDDTLARQGDLFYGSAGYYLLLALGPVFCFAAFTYRNWYRRNNSDVVKVKSRRAGKMAAKHLAEAEKQLLAGNKPTFYEDVFKGLYGYLSDKLNILWAGLNKDSIATALRARHVDEQLIVELADTLALCEMARYAPVTTVSEQEVFEKAKRIINEIEAKI